MPEGLFFVCLILDAISDNLNLFQVSMLGLCGETNLYNDCDWNSREELALLEAIENYGLGNWEDVAKLIGTRSPDEAFHHYEETYVNSNIGDSTLEKHQFGEVIDETIPKQSTIYPLVEQIATRMSDTTFEEQSQMAYLPLRDDFELDYDNTAEADIADLSPFGDPGTFDLAMNTLEFDLKVAQIHMFRRRLKERQRRHSIVHDYCLVSEFLRNRVHDDVQLSTKISKSEKSAPNYRDEIRALEKFCSPESEVPSSENSTSLSVSDTSDVTATFLQAITASEVDDLLANLKTDETLRAQVRCLQHFRKKGFRTLEECGEYLKMESPTEIKESFSNLLSKELSRTPSRNSSSDGSTQYRSCDNGHDLLSRCEEEFCKVYDIKKSIYVNAKSNVLKIIAEGCSLDEVKSRYRNQEGVPVKVANFLQQEGIIPP